MFAEIKHNLSELWRRSAAVAALATKAMNAPLRLCK